MRLEYSTSYIFRLTGLLLLLIGIVLAIHLIIEAWSWSVRISLIGIWDEWELSQAYVMMRSCLLTNLTMTTTGLLFLSLPSSADGLTRKPWSLLNFKKILAVMVLTGGTVYTHPPSDKYCVRYYGKSVLLHQVLCSLVGHIYHARAEPAQWITRGSYVTQIYNKTITEDLLALSPTYNTRNGYSSDGERVHPTAAFLADAPLDVVQEAMRLGASANGSVRYAVEPMPSSNGRYNIRPQFTFGYLSPTPLLEDYREAFNRVGIDAAPVMDRRFGRGFLMGRSWNALRAFSKMGGFIDGVKVDRGRYSGLNRNAILQGLLTFHRSENNNFATREAALETVEGYLVSHRSSMAQSSSGWLEIPTKIHLAAR